MDQDFSLGTSTLRISPSTLLSLQTYHGNPLKMFGYHGTSAIFSSNIHPQLIAWQVPTRRVTNRITYSYFGELLGQRVP